MIFIRAVVLGSLAFACHEPRAVLTDATAEGTYTLDLAETRKLSDVGLPAEMTLNLQPGGKLDMTVMIPLPYAVGIETTRDPIEPAKPDRRSGTWKKNDDAIVLSADKADMRCAKSGRKLTCTETSAGRILVFDRI